MIEQVFHPLLVNMIEQAPTIAALMYLVWRQEQALSRCYNKILALLPDGAKD